MTMTKTLSASLDELGSAQRKALLDFAEAHGRSWKDALRSGWAGAKYPGPLQQIRNEFGPEWLAALRQGDVTRALAEREPAVFVTRDEISMKWGVERNPLLHYDLLIPRGHRVLPTEDGWFFVEDLDRIIDQKARPMLYHDAEHHGIRLSADQVVRADLLDQPAQKAPKG